MQKAINNDCSNSHIVAISLGDVELHAPITDSAEAAAADHHRRSCCHSSNIVGHHPTYNTKNDHAALCLAVVRENGTDIVIFDASGTPVTFRNSIKNKSGDDDDDGDDGTSGSTTTTRRQLCFSSHGQVSSDDLLTPCFDEFGNHGIPDESCFCGVDTPHIHAHLRELCAAYQEHQQQQGGQSNKASVSANYSGALTTMLASQTLHPIPDDDGKLLLEFSIPATEGMPSACNSREIRQLFVGKNKSNFGTYSDYKASNSRRVLQKVQHDDHSDYLVHNIDTGELHLEHPCADCGSDDVHGRFQRVGKRLLSKQSGEGKDVHLHFFEIAHTPFNVLEHFTNLFEPTSDRVAAAENLIKTPRTTTKPAVGITHTPVTPMQLPESVSAGALARSTFICDKICCSSEAKMIERLLKSTSGVQKVMINIPLKQVIVHHNPKVLQAVDIVIVLNKNNDFGASIQHDGGVGAGPAAISLESGRSQFFVSHICCASEIPAINKILQPLKGISNVSINTTTKMVFVDHIFETISAQQITDALNKEGFGATLKFDAGSVAQQESSSFVRSVLTFPGENIDTQVLTQFLKMYDATQVETFVVDFPSSLISVVHNPFSLSVRDIATALHDETGIVVTISTDGADLSTWELPKFEESDKVDSVDTPTYPRPTVVLCGLFWVISMLSYFGGNWEYLKYVGVLAVVVGIPPIAIKAMRTLRRCQFDANCLMFFASLGAVALQDYAEASAVVFLFAISEWLEVRATTRARRALSTIVQLRPDKANIVHPTTKELVVIPASAVPVGAVVSVKSGDKVPCDGIVVEGRSTVDESSLTGESRPVSKGVGDTVSGGTVNCGLSQLMVRTTCTAENSAVARLIRLVEEAQANRSETEKVVDEFAKVYTPIVVLAALLMVTVPWAFGPEAGRFWTQNGLILIVVACPCALIISTPVSYVAGLAATAQKGVLIKGGAYLEALGLVKTICMDKTGTLTTGEFALLHLEVVGDRYDREQVLQFLVLAEERASHPLAQSILKAAKCENVSVPRDMALEQHTMVVGEGIQALINGLAVHVGNERMVSRLGLLETLADDQRQQMASWAKLGGTLGYMCIEGAGIAAMFCAADAVRPEARDVVSKFQQTGIRVVMLTGDNQETALAIGAQVGLQSNDIRHRLLPEEKLRFVEDQSGSDQRRSVLSNPCSARRLTLMCGDGVNDAPALACADVGVAMGAGAALAMETADVTLLDSDLRKLAYSMQMGRRVINKIKQNIVISISVKLIVLVFALLGKTSLWAAIASDVGAMLVVTLNAMLLLPGKAGNKSTDRAMALTDDPEAALSTTLSTHVPGPVQITTEKKSCCASGVCSTKRQVESESTLSSESLCNAPCHTAVHDSLQKPSCKKGCCGSDTHVSKDAEETTIPVDSGQCSPPTTHSSHCCGSDAAKPSKASEEISASHHHELLPSVNESSQTPSSCHKGCCDKPNVSKGATK